MSTLVEIEKALTSFFTTKIDTVSVPGWKTIAPTYKEATKKIFDQLVEKGLVKNFNFDDLLYFGKDDEFSEISLRSENNNLLTFREIKLVDWKTSQPEFTDWEYSRSYPEYKVLDVFSFLYIYLKNPGIFKGIEELPTFGGANFVNIFFPRKNGENMAKKFVTAWDRGNNEKTWTYLTNCEVSGTHFSSPEVACALMVTVG